MADTILMELHYKGKEHTYEAPQLAIELWKAFTESNRLDDPQQAEKIVIRKGEK